MQTPGESALLVARDSLRDVREAVNWHGFNWQMERLSGTHGGIVPEPCLRQESETVGELTDLSRRSNDLLYLHCTSDIAVFIYTVEAFID